MDNSVSNAQALCRQVESSKIFGIANAIVVLIENKCNLLFVQIKKRCRRN